ncbi:MAG TPA: hypothetical protein PK022_08595 [Syntrophales bacterium]|nr:hypothetical protein [Syntrophales bacterium]
MRNLGSDFQTVRPALPARGVGLFTVLKASRINRNKSSIAVCTKFTYKIDAFTMLSGLKILKLNTSDHKPLGWVIDMPGTLKRIKKK